MTTEGGAKAGSPRHHHLIVSIFGLYARDGSLAIADLIRLVAELGIEDAGVRSSVSRLKRRGVLESTRNGSSQAAYRLSPGLEAVFRAGDERIFTPRRAQAGDPWLLASFSVPERERHARHRIRSILTRLGFGQISPGLWVASATVQDELREALGRDGLDEYVEIFLATHVTSEHARTSVERWWDLGELNALYQEFLDRFAELRGPWLDGGVDLGEAAAFRDYISLVTEWRRLPYLDPGIPLEYLPESWAGREAEELFQGLHARLGPLARSFVDGVVAR